MSRLIKLEKSISSSLLIILTILTLLQVVTRYLFHLPLPWVEEAARYLMIFMVYIASAIAVYKLDHLNIDILNLVLSDSKMCFFNITYQTVIVIFLILFLYTSIQFTFYQIKVGQVSPALQISMGWPLSALIIGGLLMIISALGSIYRKMIVKKG